MYNYRKNKIITVVKNLSCMVCVLVLILTTGCVNTNKSAPTVDEQECAAVGSEYQIDGTAIKCTDLGEVSICDANGDVWVILTDSGLTCSDTVVLTLMDNGTTDKEDDKVLRVYNVTTHSMV